MRISTPENPADEHARQVDVCGEPGLPVALGRLSSFWTDCQRSHACRVSLPWRSGCSCHFPSAVSTTIWIASTILAYPVHRHRFPAIPSRISFLGGSRVLSSNAFAVRIIPGVQ